MKARTPFSEKEILFLRQNADRLTAPEIAVELGRNRNVILSKASAMGIKLKSYYIKRDRSKAKVGEVFGELTATGRHRRGNRNGRNGVDVELVCPHGGSKFVQLTGVRRGLINSCRRWRSQCPMFRMRGTPEYKTVYKHFRNICLKKCSNYEGMPFFDGWNPDKGGSFLIGAIWIIDNLGKRPSGTTMHIVDHAKGFVPGNLEWTHPRRQTNQQMFRIIAQQRHEIKNLKRQLVEAQQVLALYEN